MILCGIPIIMKAVIGLVTAFDIKADVHSDKEYFNNSYRVFQRIAVSVPTARQAGSPRAMPIQDYLI